MSKKVKAQYLFPFKEWPPIEPGELTTLEWQIVNKEIEFAIRRNEMFTDWYKNGLFDVTRDEFLLKIREQLIQRKRLEELLHKVNKKC